MCPLEVSLFGDVRVSFNQGAEEIRLTRTIQGLFSFLILHRSRLYSRDVLVNLFWGETAEDHARASLNTALWRLRNSLEPKGTPHGTYLIINQLGEVGFNPISDFWLDVSEFEERLSKLLMLPIEHMVEEYEEEFERSLNLYRGDLLDGFYDDWALRERERLRFLYMNGLAYLMRYYERKHAYEKSLICGQRILALDPLREEIHRAMMRLYLNSDQRTLAMRQYEFCCKVLEEELNVSPMDETKVLYEQIFTHRTPRIAGVEPPDRESLEKLLGHIEQTKRVIDSAQEQLRLLTEAVMEMITR